MVVTINRLQASLAEVALPLFLLGVIGGEVARSLCPENIFDPVSGVTRTEVWLPPHLPDSFPEHLSVWGRSLLR